MKKHRRKSLKIAEEAKALFEGKEYEKALDLCEEALLHSIRNEEAWRLKAIALGKLERNDEAVFAAEKRMGIFPESELAVYDYCLELVRGGMEAELKKFEDKLPKEEPRSESMRKIFDGLLALKSGKGEEAKRLLGEGAAEPGIFLVIIEEAKEAVGEILPRDGEIAEFVRGRIADARRKELEMLRQVYGQEGAEDGFAKIAEDKELGAMAKEEFERKLFEVLSSSHAHSHAHGHEHEPTREDMDAVFDELEREPEKYREEYSKFLEERTRPGWRYKEKELFAEFVYLLAKKRKLEKEHGGAGEGEGHEHGQDEEKETGAGEKRGGGHEEGEERGSEEKLAGAVEKKGEGREAGEGSEGERKKRGEKEKKEHAREHKRKEKHEKEANL